MGFSSVEKTYGQLLFHCCMNALQQIFSIRLFENPMYKANLGLAGKRSSINGVALSLNPIP